MREHYYAYRRGVRTAKRYNGKYAYWKNPYKYQTSQWYSFNIGWNDWLQNRVI